MENRVKQLKEKLVNHNIEAFIIYNEFNRRYLSGFTGSSGYLYISQAQQCLLTDFRYIEQANKQAPNFEIIDHMKLGLMKTFEALMEADKVKRIGFESDSMTVSQLKELKTGLSSYEFESTSNMVEELRQIKDEGELKLIRRAASLADEAFTHILPFIKVGVTELDIALELEFFMRRSGAAKLSFDSIVASGKNSSLPHANPTNKMLENGDFLTMDFGCVIDGYCSDMTRTVLIGKASDQHKKIYNVVLEAQKEALEAIRSGVIGQDIDRVARDIIYGSGFKENFGHGLGHSLGLEVHENPRFNTTSTTVIQKNMMMTVEPGIYISDFGGVRIEDLICVKENGIENFTNSVKTLIEIES